MEEICQHTTERSQHNQIQRKKYKYWMQNKTYLSDHSEIADIARKHIGKIVNINFMIKVNK